VPDISLYAPTEVPALLRRLRRHKGLSQQQVAEAMGIQQPTVSALERGVRACSLPVLMQLLDLYGSSLKISDPDPNGGGPDD
jgi:transcriptional regulator with XRE-family HTH domain